MLSLSNFTLLKKHKKKNRKLLLITAPKKIHKAILNVTLVGEALGDEIMD
jgi:hypothetical protein